VINVIILNKIRISEKALGLEKGIGKKNLFLGEAKILMGFFIFM
jgi:hypothetical protein